MIDVPVYLDFDLVSQAKERLTSDFPGSTLLSLNSQVGYKWFVDNGYFDILQFFYGGNIEVFLKDNLNECNETLHNLELLELSCFGNFRDLNTNSLSWNDKSMAEIEAVDLSFYDISYGFQSPTKPLEVKRIYEDNPDIGGVFLLLRDFLLRVHLPLARNLFGNLTLDAMIKKMGYFRSPKEGLYSLFISLEDAKENHNFPTNRDMFLCVKKKGSGIKMYVDVINSEYQKRVNMNEKTEHDFQCAFLILSKLMKISCVNSEIKQYSLP